MLPVWLWMAAQVALRFERAADCRVGLPVWTPPRFSKPFGPTTAGLLRLNRKPQSPDELISISVDEGGSWHPVQKPPSECHVGVFGESRLAATQDFLYCSSDEGLWIGRFEPTRP